MRRVHIIGGSTLHEKSTYIGDQLYTRRVHIQGINSTQEEYIYRWINSTREECIYRGSKLHEKSAYIGDQLYTRRRVHTCR